MFKKKLEENTEKTEEEKERERQAELIRSNPFMKYGRGIMNFFAP